MFKYPTAPGQRLLVSAPRPDSVMLRLRSLRAAGMLNIRPGASRQDVSVLRRRHLNNLRLSESRINDLPFRISAR